MSVDPLPDLGQIALCLYVRDAAPDIQEWIAYHRLLGFGTFVIYDNGSRDDTVRLARAMSRIATIHIQNWAEQTGADAQQNAYLHCISRFAPDFDWLMFLDSDEFLAHPHEDTVESMIRRHADSSAIAFNWSSFGSNGYTHSPSGLVIESFTQRGVDTFGPNGHTKMLVRPGTVTAYANPHFFHVDGRTLGPEMQELEWHQPGITKQVSASGWKVNHYFVRSWQQWREKLARGYRDISRSEELFHEYDRNEVEDLSAARRAKEVYALLDDTTL